MVNYACTCKIIRGGQGNIETLIQNYVNSLDNSKVLRSVTVSRFGADSLIAVIIHDT